MANWPRDHLPGYLTWKKLNQEEDDVTGQIL